MPSDRSFSIRLLSDVWNSRNRPQFLPDQQHDPAEWMDAFLQKYRGYLRYFECMFYCLSLLHLALEWLFFLSTTYDNKMKESFLNDFFSPSVNTMSCKNNGIFGPAPVILYIITARNEKLTKYPCRITCLSGHNTLR